MTILINIMYYLFIIGLPYDYTTVQFRGINVIQHFDWTFQCQLIVIRINVVSA